VKRGEITSYTIHLCEGDKFTYSSEYPVVAKFTNKDKAMNWLKNHVNGDLVELANMSKIRKDFFTQRPIPPYYHMIITPLSCHSYIMQYIINQ